MHTGNATKHSKTITAHDSVAVQDTISAHRIKQSFSLYDHFARRWVAVFLILLFVVTTTSGCVVYPSQQTTFTGEVSGRSASDGIVVEPSQETVDVRDIIKEAITYTNEHPDTQQFWYSGYVRNTMEQHLVTSMFDGVMLRPLNAFLVNARIAGQPYQYYSRDGATYIRKDNNWYELTEEQPLPFDPFRGFSDWLPLMENATVNENTSVLGIPTRSYEVRIRGDEWIKQADSALFEELKVKLEKLEQQKASDNSQTNMTADDSSSSATEEISSLQQILEQTIVKTTIWIGRDEPILYQYETWIVMPLPDGGYFDQLTHVHFFRYNDPSIESMIPSVASIREWMEQMEKQSETELME